jgi:hypothetical protein
MANAPIAVIAEVRQFTMMYQPNSMARPTWIGTLVGSGLGIAISVPAIIGAIMSGGAGHGSYVAARVLFPFSMLFTRLEGSIGTVAMTVGLLQFPLYGALIGRAAALRTYQISYMLMAVHLVAVLACFAGLLPDLS